MISISTKRVYTLILRFKTKIYINSFTIIENTIEAIKLQVKKIEKTHFTGTTHIRICKTPVQILWHISSIAGSKSSTCD